MHTYFSKHIVISYAMKVILLLMSCHFNFTKGSNLARYEVTVILTRQVSKPQNVTTNPQTMVTYIFTRNKIYTYTITIYLSACVPLIMNPWSWCCSTSCSVEPQELSCHWLSATLTHVPCVSTYTLTHRHIYIDAPLAFGSRVNVAAILGRWRLACKQTHVNGGAAAFLDKKHYIVYISQPISLCRFYIQRFMIYVEYQKKFCLHVT